MSAAAEQAASQFSHPKVRGSAQAFLNLLAKLIPEGDTMTAAIGIDELARLTGYYEKSIRQARDVLVEIGVLRIVGGGQGRAASYELLLLDGAGAPPALPLRADLRSVPPRPASAGPDLFEEPGVVVEATVARDATDLRANNIGKKYRSYRSWLTHIGTFYRSYRTAVVTNFGTFYRSGRSIVTVAVLRANHIGKKYRSSSPTSVQDVDVDDARAREVRTHVQDVHTHAAAAAAADTSGPHEIQTPPCRYADAVHAWCAGRVHVPRELHREFLRRHGRLAGESDVDVEAKLFAFYTKRSAELPADEPIVDNDFKFWRKAYAAEFAPSRARPTEVDPTQQPANVWQQILARIEPKVSRHTFHTWFLPLVQITDAGAVIEVAKPGDSRLFADWIRKHHSDLVRAAVDEVRPGAHVEVIDVDALERRFGS